MITNTRNASIGGLKSTKINTTSFGNRSLRYSATWNNCIKSIKEFIGNKSISQLKSYMYLSIVINVIKVCLMFIKGFSWIYI